MPHAACRVGRSLCVRPLWHMVQYPAIMCAERNQMTMRRPIPPTSWIWLLSLFTLASFIETVFWGQMSAFTPLYLPRLGVAPDDVVVWTGITVAVASAVGIPFLPFWGALAGHM